MGGTIDGEIYQLLNDAQKRELEELTGQDVVSLSEKEARLAALLDKETRAPMFAAKHATEELGHPEEYNLEDEIKSFLKKKGIEF